MSDEWQDIANIWRTRAHATREECAALCERIGDETAAFYAAAIRALSEGQAPEPETPAAKWRKEGKPDPHGSHYDGERAKLACGHMTDDEIANAVYLNPGIVNLTAAKERIRWLSRKLCAPTQQAPEPVAQEPVSAYADLIACLRDWPDMCQQYSERAANVIEQFTHPAGMDAARPKAEPVAQDRYVQPVPDHCDRIVWRGQYFGLPLAVPAGMDPARAKAIEDCEAICVAAANAYEMNCPDGFGAQMARELAIQMRALKGAGS